MSGHTPWSAIRDRARNNPERAAKIDTIRAEMDDTMRAHQVEVLAQNPIYTLWDTENNNLIDSGDDNLAMRQRALEVICLAHDGPGSPAWLCLSARLEGGHVFRMGGVMLRRWAEGKGP